MGKAARWLKSLLGMKKEREIHKNSDENDSKRERRRWSFARSAKDPVRPAADDSIWLGRYLSETEREQNKHAIAVAAATAAAADAAVAAAQAAVAVVRLTSHGSGAALFCAGREMLAAVKIQTVFRGYLARKASRALKGLVKLQAVVRGYLVRKRATTTLRSMRALVRAQSSARSRRPCRSMVQQISERFEEPRSEFHSRRISGSYDSCYEDSPKIVEVDTYRTRSRSSRRTNYPPSISDHSEDNGHFQYPATSSPAPARLSIPDRRHLHNDWGFYEGDNRQRHYQALTAHSTPRCVDGLGPQAPPTPAKSVCGENEGYFRPYYNHHGSNYSCPNYMVNTLSFRAKVRSQSAPRHRPEPSPSRRRFSMNEVLASRSSVSGVRVRKSCSSVPQVADL